MKKLYSTLIFCLLYLSVAAQITTNELPVSFNLPPDQLKTLSTDLRIMPKLDMARISEEDQKDIEDGLPPRFGFPHEVNFNLSNSGIWSSLPNGDRIWQLSIQCSDALSINLLYDKFWLPDGAKLFLYTSDKSHTIGAITSQNNKGTVEDLQGFATGLLYGESITLEYYVPKDVKEDGVISIAKVVHGYRY